MSKKNLTAAAVFACVAALQSLPASAVPVNCEDTTRNYMAVDSTIVSSCVDAGVGNINGNPITDDFLTANPALDYEGIGSAAFTQYAPETTRNRNEGTFEFDSSLWNSWESIAIGFKFGTGGQPDNWFVYLLNSDVSSGDWDFINVNHRGGGLSHIQLYGVTERSVPEPTTLALLGAGLVGIALGRRRKRADDAR